MTTVAFAFPLLPGKLEDLKGFGRDLLGPRRAEFEASQRRHGVNAEYWIHQPSPQGDLVLVVIEAADPMAGMGSLAASQDPFDLWQKERIKALSGVDMSQPQSGPPPEQVFAWPA